MKNTGEICIVTVSNNNREDGYSFVDIGNYFKTDSGEKCVVTTKKLAKKYGHLINAPIYTIKEITNGNN